MAPEVWKQVRYNEKSDIWSAGVILFEMCAMRTPFTAEDIKSLATKVKYNPVPDIPGHYSSILRNLVRAMLQKDPSMRPSMKQILMMPEIAKHLDKIPSLTESQATRCFGGSDQLTGGKNISPEMLRTIKVTHNMCQIRLPPPRYPGMKTSSSADAAAPSAPSVPSINPPTQTAADENAAPNTARDATTASKTSKTSNVPVKQPHSARAALSTKATGSKVATNKGAPGVASRGHPGVAQKRVTSARGARNIRPKASSAWARAHGANPIVGGGNPNARHGAPPRPGRPRAPKQSKATAQGYHGHQPRGRRIYTR